MVVKSQIKLIRSLQQKKYRNQHGLFFVEGKKGVEALLQSNFEPHSIYTDQVVLSNVPEAVLFETSSAEFEQMSFLKNPNGVLGVFHIPKPTAVDFEDWILALDALRDPGNLGTIIRLCDWFGIRHIVCSQNTVDCYNPKVLQATMGSIARVSITYTDLEEFLMTSKSPIYGAYMDGDSVYESKLPAKGVVVLGNEANGISDAVGALVEKKVAIPPYGGATAESLNVATAGAILLNEIRRG